MVKVSPFHPFKPLWLAEFAVLFIVLLLANVSALSWLRNESLKFLRNKCNNEFPKECKLELNFLDRLDSCISLLVMSWPRLSASIVSLLIIAVIEISSRLHRKQVLVSCDRRRKESANAAFRKFQEYRKYVPESLLYATGLTDIATKLRELVQRVENNEVPFETPSAYLTSPEAEEFFKKATWRMKFFLKVVNGTVVRSRPLRAVLAFVVVLLSCSFSVAAAMATADSCTDTIVFFQFLEFFSLSFLTALGIMIFAGFNDYNRFRYMFVDVYPFTENEKFIISLVAANRDVQLNGFLREDFADYAKLGLEGDAAAFIPLHSSLLPFAGFDDQNNL